MQQFRNGAYVGMGALAFAAALALCHTLTGGAAENPRVEFVKIAPGEFTMGCSDNDAACNADEKPAHPVRITKAFEIGKFEVTQAQWQTVMSDNPSVMKGETRPVENVSKDEVLSFIAKLNANGDGFTYRLPTEAEWEYAARAGSRDAFPGGLQNVAWFGGNAEDESHAVGKKKPNAWGVYDMQGNVREWVSDLYSATYYSNSPATDPPDRRLDRTALAALADAADRRPTAMAGSLDSAALADNEVHVDSAGLWFPDSRAPF